MCSSIASSQVSFGTVVVVVVVEVVVVEVVLVVVVGAVVVGAEDDVASPCAPQAVTTRAKPIRERRRMVPLSTQWWADLSHRAGPHLSAA
jgi:hypothetical protein